MMKSTDSPKAFTVRLPIEAEAKLMEMVATGLYGANRASVANTLILEGIKKAISDGVISRPATQREEKS